MACRPPATEIVVIHHRQIIVNQRIGMNAFDRASQWHCFVRVTATSFIGSKA